jgi:2-amino-4-hydroxy-6-hydroxymethyldihydropteridine diphosphokinase/dihydropteroate synthase
MTKATLGLGANLGDRKHSLETATARLSERARPGSLKVSSLYETPALLPEKSPDTWNKPYLNLALEADFEGSPAEMLLFTQQIERELGRGAHEKWAPRSIDIDLLLWGNERMMSQALTIPHPRIEERAFVLDPLKDLNPDFLSRARDHAQHAPLWMGILNATPDSFSDGGKLRDQGHLEKKLDLWDAYFVPILDIGAESTRPGALAVSPSEEWQRLEPWLRVLASRYQGKFLRPLISVDTRHAGTAERAIELGADMINDVGGLAPGMLDVLKNSQAKYVLMHPGKTSSPPIPEILAWFRENTRALETAGVSYERVWVDPGVGFGKTGNISFEILRGLEQFKELPYRMLVGHSRKAFLNSFAPATVQISAPERDLETIGVSLGLVAKGVDVLRVHDPVAHIRAFRAWKHLS